MLSKICKKLKIKFQTAYSYIFYYPQGFNHHGRPHGRHIPCGMEISIKSEGNRVELLNRVGLLNEVIAQLDQLRLKNSSKKFKAINKGFSKEKLEKEKVNLIKTSNKKRSEI